jgi:hypothetical protein
MRVRQLAALAGGVPPRELAALMRGVLVRRVAMLAGGNLVRKTAGIIGSGRSAGPRRPHRSGPDWTLVSQPPDPDPGAGSWSSSPASSQPC